MKLPIKLQKFPEIHYSIIQRQLKVKKKKLIYYIYIRNKHRKLLVVEGEYNNIIIEYQKIINPIDNIPSQPSKFRTENWTEINDHLWEHTTS